MEASGSDPLARSVDTTTAIAPSLRLEQGFFQDSQIGVFYDPMIAKLIVHGRDRTEALRVLRKALEEYRVVGVSTNVEFLRSLAGHESFIEGDVETGFIKVCSLLFLRRSDRLTIRRAETLYGAVSSIS